MKKLLWNMFLLRFSLSLSAVQLAKIAGNKVVATCGGADKAALLHELGVDRVIDYKKETIKTVCALYKNS